MHRWWAFTPPVWCEFGGFSRYNFYSAQMTGYLWHQTVSGTKKTLFDIQLWKLGIKLSSSSARMHFLKEH